MSNSLALFRNEAAVTKLDGLKKIIRL